MYGFESYISVPIYRPDGRFFGTLCALDAKRAAINTPRVVETFKLFGALIGFHLDAQERLINSEKALRDERQDANLREQFIAVLGHDLRNPLNTINLGAAQLLAMPLEAKATRVAELIRRSAARMAGLIDNVMDFARSRMGEGFSLNLRADSRLADAMQQVIAEAHTIWPDRTVRCAMVLNQPVVCDSARVAQLFSNLLANALTHGDSELPVSVDIHNDNQGFELAVSNHGEAIAADIMERLFQPFTRASVRPSQQGLRLGLYIAPEIARAHGGVLRVTSSAKETRFTFSMPPRPA
jgi:signal transduction histidine kinase